MARLGLRGFARRRDYGLGIPKVAGYKSAGGVKAAHTTTGACEQLLRPLRTGTLKGYPSSQSPRLRTGRYQAKRTASQRRVFSARSAVCARRRTKADISELVMIFEKFSELKLHNLLL